MWVSCGKCKVWVKLSFLPAAEIIVVCLDGAGGAAGTGSVDVFPRRQGKWQLRSGARHITALKISPAFDSRHRAVIQSVPSLESARIKPSPCSAFKDRFTTSRRSDESKIHQRENQGFQCLGERFWRCMWNKMKAKNVYVFSLLHGEEK